MLEAHDSKIDTRRTEQPLEAAAREPAFNGGTLLLEGRNQAQPTDKTQPVSVDGKLRVPSVYSEVGVKPAPAMAPGSTDAAAVQAKAATLFDPNATAEQKLAAVKDLAAAGISDFDAKDKSGHVHHLRLELEAAGHNRSMVHLFVEGANGREYTALRGISRADGSFEQERDRRGHHVSYEGKGYSHLYDRPDAAALPGGVDEPLPAHRPQPATNGDERSPAVAEAPQAPPPPEGIPGGMDRSQFAAQLHNPRILAMFAGRMYSEVGTQGFAAQVAFAEEVMNRAASRGQSLEEALSGSYYPHSRPGYSDNPQYIKAIETAYLYGTDITHGATGNASGGVGFGRGGFQTARFGGEKFGWESVDIGLDWQDKYKQLKAGGSVASREMQRQNEAV